MTRLTMDPTRRGRASGLKGAVPAPPPVPKPESVGRWAWAGRISRDGDGTYVERRPRPRSFKASPPVFSKVGSAFLVRRVQTRADQTAFDALLVRHAELLTWGPTSDKDLDRAPLEHAARVSFLKAVRAYKSDSSASFETFARTCIRNAKLDWLRSAKRDRSLALASAASLDATLELGDKDSTAGHGTAHGGVADPKGRSKPEARTLTLAQFREVRLTRRERDAIQAELEGSEGDRHALNRARKKLEDVEYPPHTDTGRKLASNGESGRRRQANEHATRTTETAKLRGKPDEYGGLDPTDAIRTYNQVHGRDTSRGGMPWPPTPQLKLASSRPELPNPSLEKAA